MEVHDDDKDLDDYDEDDSWWWGGWCNIDEEEDEEDEDDGAFEVDGVFHVAGGEDGLAGTDQVLNDGDVNFNVMMTVTMMTMTIWNLINTIKLMMDEDVGAGLGCCLRDMEWSRTSRIWQKVNI